MKQDVSNSTHEKPPFELTGKHVFTIVVGAFSVVIGINVFMAVLAVKTFPGLEAKNSYVASQEFDAQRSAQDALGWDVSAKIIDETLLLDIKNDQGAPVTAASVYGLFGRATHVKEDQEPDFIQSENGTYVAKIGKIGSGNWNLRLNVIAENGTSFQRRIPLFIRAN